MSNGIISLTASNVPQALALSQAAGWNQTSEDWQLAIEMNPYGSFAMEIDGRIAATTTSIRYGKDLAWVGMVLTHPEFRGRGFARALMARVLDHLEDVQTIKLDATEMGEPLYRQLGFVEECAIERWIRFAQITTPSEVGEYTPNPKLDEDAFGADRSVLLERLATIEAASLSDAFAMGRGNRFGPCVSRSKESAAALAHWFLARHPNESVLWDPLPGNASALAESLGFERFRSLKRMTRGRVLEANDSLIYAGAGFEFG